MREATANYVDATLGQANIERRYDVPPGGVPYATIDPNVIHVTDLPPFATRADCVVQTYIELHEGGHLMRPFDYAVFSDEYASLKPPYRLDNLFIDGPVDHLYYGQYKGADGWRDEGRLAYQSQFIPEEIAPIDPDNRKALVVTAAAMIDCLVRQRTYPKSSRYLAVAFNKQAQGTIVPKLVKLAKGAGFVERFRELYLDAEADNTFDILTAIDELLKLWEPHLPSSQGNPESDNPDGPGEDGEQDGESGEGDGQAVKRYAGMEPGRPVGGTYYLYRTLRNLDIDGVLERLLEQEQNEDGEAPSDFEQRLARDEYQSRANQLQQEIEAEIRRRLVADRGVEAMAKTLRKPLPEDVDFMHASREEMASLRKAIWPLTRKLAARLQRKRRHGRKGPLDFRRTVRASLSYGGVPAEPKFRNPRPHKPEIFVIADISGSVAAFARFTLHLVYAISGQFSKVRAFVFIDGLDEVTHMFEGVEDINEAVHRVNTEADVVWVDGHSDYGHALGVFWEKYGNEIGPRTSIMILGDARNNYHASESWIIKAMNEKARAVHWLNPEPQSYWDTGDSIVGEYAQHCDGTFEVRNLRQLEAFVDNLA